MNDLGGPIRPRGPDRELYPRRPDPEPKKLDAFGVIVLAVVFFAIVLPGAIILGKFMWEAALG